MVIVLDTNCLIQILPKQAEHRWLYDAILNGELILAITTEILNEYEETINTFYESSQLGENVVKLILNLPNTKKVSPSFKWAMIYKDPDDNKYPDCAVTAQADYIITHDRHFKILESIDFPKVICVSLEESKAIFGKFLEKTK